MGISSLPPLRGGKEEILLNRRDLATDGKQLPVNPPRHVY